MSKESGDVLRIPIEIKTDDLQELQSLIQEITEAQSAVRELVPMRGRGIESPSRSAVSPSFDEGFGIFSSIREGETLPSKTRDKTSRQAFQRESEFSRLREQVMNAQNGQKSLDDKLNSIMNGVFGINIATGGKQSAGPIFSSAGKIVSGGTAGLLTGLVGKLVPYIGTALLAVGFMETIKNELFKPGGVFDVRFKRNFKKESNILTSLEEKADIRAGRRVIRVTTMQNIRGLTKQQFSTLDMLKHGIAPYDLNGAAAARNII